MALWWFIFRGKHSLSLRDNTEIFKEEIIWCHRIGSKPPSQGGSGVSEWQGGGGVGMERQGWPWVGNCCVWIKVHDAFFILFSFLHMWEIFIILLKFNLAFYLNLLLSSSVCHLQNPCSFLFWKVTDLPEEQSFRFSFILHDSTETTNHRLVISLVCSLWPLGQRPCRRH